MPDQIWILALAMVEAELLTFVICRWPVNADRFILMSPAEVESLWRCIDAINRLSLPCKALRWALA